MKTAVKHDFKIKTFCIRKSDTPLLAKEISLVNLKFYQKLLTFLISFSVVLIFPDSPRELGNICESYNSRKVCDAW